MKSEDSWVVSATGLARLLRVSSGLVTKWLDAKMPASRRTGRSGARVEIDLREALPWIVDYVRRQQSPEPGSNRDRLANAQAERIEMENAARRAELMPVAAVGATLIEIAAETAAQLDAIPSRCANELAGISDPATIRQRLLSEHRDARRAIAKKLESLADQAEGAVGIYREFRA